MSSVKENIIKIKVLAALIGVNILKFNLKGHFKNVSIILSVNKSNNLRVIWLN